MEKDKERVKETSFQTFFYERERESARMDVAQFVRLPNGD